MSSYVRVENNGRTVNTGMTQEQNVKLIKQKAHKFGYFYRSRKNPDGSVSLICRPKEGEKNDK